MPVPLLVLLLLLLLHGSIATGSVSIVGLYPLTGSNAAAGVQIRTAVSVHLRRKAGRQLRKHCDDSMVQQVHLAASGPAAAALGVNVTVVDVDSGRPAAAASIATANALAGGGCLPLLLCCCC